MLSWLQNQVASRSENGPPVAPKSVQGAAAHWEPSVQNMVGERGGLKISELESAVSHKWPFKFKINKVWRLRDAISDKGIHAYIEHHWLILELHPQHAAGPDHSSHSGTTPGRPAKKQRSQDESAATPSSDQDSEIPANGTSLQGEQHTVETSVGGRGFKGSEGAQEHKAPTSKGGKAEDLKKVTEEEVVLTSEAHLSAAQERSFNPTDDCGMQFADEGHVWFLRIDRFDQADKWFACESFENAMSSTEAREKHYRPSSELLYEAGSPEESLYLECIIPLLAKLADIKYSVFAKGHHCQWHALLVARMIATLHEFAFPGRLHQDFTPQVSLILTDLKEQQRYATIMAKAFYSPDIAYLREYPEAPFLKGQISALQALCSEHPGRLPPSVLSRKFPDVALLYNSILSEVDGLNKA